MYRPELSTGLCINGTFYAPDDAEFLREFGSEVVAAEGEPWVRTVTVPLDEDSEFRLSYDRVAAWVEITWRVGGHPVVVVSREQAVRLTLVTEKGTTGFAVEFDHGEARGRLLVQVFPTFAMTDSVLAG